MNDIDGIGEHARRMVAEAVKREADLHKLAAAFFSSLTYDDSCEYGSVGVDCKRPFGNSDVEGDVLEIIDANPEGDDGHDKCWSSKQREYAEVLYKTHLVPYLQKWWAKSTQVSV